LLHSFHTKNLVSKWVDLGATRHTCCICVEPQTELSGLIHTDLTYLRKIMSKGGKHYFVMFINDYSRYAKVYLIKHKDETFDVFLTYKEEVENQLNKKIKTLMD